MGVSGKLIMNALVMYDRQTQTLWSQFLGKAVEGPLAGKVLELVPSQLTTWGEWKSEHPETLVLDTGLEGPSFDSYSRYYTDGRSGAMGQTNYDGQAVLQGAGARPLQRLRSESIRLPAPQRAPGRQRPVRRTPHRRHVQHQRRRLSGLRPGISMARPLSFEQAETTRGSCRIERPGPYGTKITAVALSGPLKGRRLRRIASFAAFWFAWSDFYPDTGVYAH